MKQATQGRTRRGLGKAAVAAGAALATGGAGVQVATGAVMSSTRLAGAAPPLRLIEYEPFLLTASGLHNDPAIREAVRAWLAAHGLDANDCMALLFRDSDVTATVLRRNAAGEHYAETTEAGYRVPATQLVTVRMQWLPPLAQFGGGPGRLLPLPVDLGDDWRAVIDGLPTVQGQWEGEYD